jgi:WD40 repeat protein
MRSSRRKQGVWFVIWVVFVLNIQLLAYAQISHSVSDIRDIRALAWSPDETTLAIGGQVGSDEGIWLYNSQTFEVDRLETTSNVLSVAWNPSGDRIAARLAGAGDAYQVWDVYSGNVLFAFEQPYETSDSSIYWSPDVLVRDSTNGSIQFTLGDPTPTAEASVIGVFWSLDGDEISIATGDNIVSTWDITSTSATLIRETNHRTILSIAQGPDGDTVAIGSSEGVIHVIEPTTGNLLHVFQGNSNELIDFVAWYADGNRLVSASRQGNIRIWSLTNNQQVAAIEYGGAVRAFALSPTNDILAYAGSGSNSQLPPLVIVLTLITSSTETPTPTATP